MKRPIIWALIFLCSGIAAGFINKGGWFIVLLFLAALLCAAAICFAYRWPPAAVFFICFICGFLRVGQSLGTDPEVSQWANSENLRLYGYVLESGQTASSRARIVFDIYLIERGDERLPVRMRILAVLPEGREAAIGDGLVLRGVLSDLDEARNPGAFNEFIFYRARKIQYKCFPDMESIFGHRGSPFNRALSKWRQRVADVYENVLPHEEAAIVRSVVLGDKSGLDETTSDLYRAAGIYHMLCVSGLHISVISLILYRLTGLFIDKRRAGAINLALLITYCIFTGSSISAVRSVLMAGIVIIGEILFRERDVPSSVGFAAVCILLYEPLYICDVGFQLSFSAVFGIAALTAPVDRQLSRFVMIPRALRTAASGNLAAILGTLPCMLYHFYIITPYAFFANLIILPTSSILVTMGVITGCIGVFWPSAAEFTAGSLYILLRFYRSVCEFFQNIPAAEVIIGSCGLVLALIMAVTILLFALWSSGRPGQMKTRGYLFFVSLAVCTATALFHYRRPDFEITMLDVGQSEAFVIRQGRWVFVLDGGGLPNALPGRNTGNRVLIPYLNYLGVSRINGVFISHTDYDHAAGIAELLPQKQIDRLYFSNAVERDDAMYMALAGACAELQIPVSYLSKGDMIKTDKMCIDTVYPNSDSQVTGNDASLVQQFFYGGASVLFTGDIDSTVEKRLEFAVPVVLKLPHHGSKYSNNEEFLRKASPPFAIVSTGRRNVYGFPANDTLERLRNLNIPLYNTAERGAVILTFQKNEFLVKTMIGEKRVLNEGS